jgi:hypothetical protein
MNMPMIPNGLHGNWISGKLIGLVLSSVALLMFSLQTQADIVVVMSANSAVTTLSRGQVNEIYLGKQKELPDGAKPMLLILGSGAEKEEFFDKVLRMSDAQAKGYWARLTFTGKGNVPKEVNDVSDLKKILAANKNAIGFMEKSAVDDSVKIVSSP